MILPEGGAILKRRIIFAVGLVAIGFTLGLMGPRLLARAFRHGLEWNLRRQLAGAEQIKVRVDPVQPKDLLGGVVSGLKITGYNFTTRNGLSYRRLEFESRRLQVDPVQLLIDKEIIWRKMEESRLLVEVDEDALTKWLRQEHPEWEPEIHFLQGKLSVKGRYDLGIGRVAFTSVGRLKIDEGDALIFQPETMKIAGISLPERLLGKKLEKTVGGLTIPLMIPFPLTLKSYAIRQGRLRVIWE